jgi:non-ribosomal peptide synthetase component F
LPTDRPRPPLESFDGSRFEFHLPATLGRALRELARRDGATLFMVLLAAYQVLLARWSGQQDIVVGVPIAGRSTPEIEGLIGFFVNTLALRATVDPACSFRELLGRVQEDLTVGAYANQELPFELLVKELRPERHLTRQPIFQTALIVQNYPDEPLQLPGLSSSPLTVERVNTHFDLALYVHGARGTDDLTATFEYASDLFAVDTIARMAAHVAVLLEAIVAAPERRVGDLPLLGKAEHALLSAWNDTSIPCDEHALVHELFEAQVTMTPDAVAVTCAGQSLTFAELNVQANRLARVLRSKGAGPDRLVAICAERGPGMVIGSTRTIRVSVLNTCCATPRRQCC